MDLADKTFISTSKHIPVEGFAGSVDCVKLRQVHKQLRHLPAAHCVQQNEHLYQLCGLCRKHLYRSENSSTGGTLCQTFVKHLKFDFEDDLFDFSNIILAHISYIEIRQQQWQLY